MSKLQEPPLLLELKPSERLKRLLVSVHGLALAASLISYLPVVFKVVLLVIICSHLYFAVKHLNRVCCKIRHSEGFAWEVWAGNGFESVQILNSTVITLFAVILHFKRENARKQAILILNDALSKDAYRHLIVRLKTTVIK